MQFKSWKQLCNSYFLHLTDNILADTLHFICNNLIYSHSCAIGYVPVSDSCIYYSTPNLQSLYQIKSEIMLILFCSLLSVGQSRLDLQKRTIRRIPLIIQFLILYNFDNLPPRMKRITMHKTSHSQFIDSIYNFKVSSKKTGHHAQSKA